jgi:soluble lytic murein transglycosylase
LCEAYGKLAGAARRYRVGQSAASWSVLDAAPVESNRWVWECVYPRPYEGFARALEARYELPQDLIYAVMRQESAFKPSARSPADARGLMQLIPPTAERVAQELGKTFEQWELHSPALNIEFGSYYLGKLLKMFGGNLVLATAAYNAGPIAVSRWLKSGEELPLDVFVARIPYTETRNYVARVVGNYARYAYLARGPEAVESLDLSLPRGLRAHADAY